MEMTTGDGAEPGKSGKRSRCQRGAKRDRDAVTAEVVVKAVPPPELWPNLGDRGLRKAAYRGGWRACQNLPKERYATMSHTTVAPLRRPDGADDPLTAVLRSGARRLLAQATEVEAEAFLAAMKGVVLSDERERLVRHGHGPVAVQRVKLRDRSPGDAAERIRFTSSILPR
jgi:hypothetical protein